MTLEELREILGKCWSKETSADPENWTPENPAWGQCAVTALVVQNFFGGELLRAIAANEKEKTQWSHYWNRLPDGKEIDLTKEQFPAGTTILKGETRTREYALSFVPTKKRFVLLRLAVENAIKPNPLFSDPIYKRCFEAALESECQKMKFGCVVVCDYEIIASAANKIIEPLRYFCEPECIRFKILSRTESMIGACAHAEELAEVEMRKLGVLPRFCSFYIAGFNAKTNDPWIKKEADHSCLRCATHLYMAGVGKICVPFIDRWASLTPEEAVKQSAAYALKDKKI